MAIPVWYFVAAFLAILCYLNWQKRNSLPPGPTPIPLLGNGYQFLLARLRGKSNVDLMREWKNEFGGVYTIWIGPMPAVLVCDYHTAMEAFVRNADAHAGRTTTFLFQKPREHLGIIFNDGPSWMTHRRFALRVLRNFGLGRNIMQERILEEANYRFEILDEQIDAGNGQVTMNPAPMLDFLIASIMNKLLAGYRYDEESAEFLHLKHNLDRMLEIITPFDQILFNAFTHKLPILRDRWAIVARPQFEIMELMKRQIKDRQEEIASGRHQIDVSSDGDDFMDAFFIEMKKREETGQDLGVFTEEHLAATLLDLWIAGTETTIGTLLWSFVYILNYPEVQVKMRAEIARVTNRNRSVELADRSQMPYTCAVITETLRCGNIMNFNLFHRVTRDTQVGDYFLPAGTVTVPQVSVIVTEEREFENPDKFDPNRFVENRNLEKQVIPFSIGKRSCLGESLARAEMFLILANFIQKYQVSVPEGCAPPSMEQISLKSLVKRARRYEMTVKRVY